MKEETALNNYEKQQHTFCTARKSVWYSAWYADRWLTGWMKESTALTKKTRNILLYIALKISRYWITTTEHLCCHHSTTIISWIKQQVITNWRLVVSECNFLSNFPWSSDGRSTCRGCVVRLLFPDGRGCHVARSFPYPPLLTAALTAWHD